MHTSIHLVRGNFVKFEFSEERETAGDRYHCLTISKMGCDVYVFLTADQAKQLADTILQRLEREKLMEIAKKMGKMEAYLLKLPKGPESEKVIEAYLELVEAIGMETDFAKVVKEAIAI